MVVTTVTAITGASTVSVADAGHPLDTGHPSLGANGAKWTAIGLSTAPADRESAAEAVRMAYRTAGLPVPSRILWLPSPAAGARAAALLTGRRDLPGVDSGADGFADVLEALREQDCPPTPGSAGVPVRAAVRATPWATARDEVRGAIGAEGWARLWTACGAEVWRLVNHNVAAPLGTHLLADLPEAARPVMQDAVAGQHDAGLLAAFDAVHPGTRSVTPWPPPAVLQAAHRLAGLAGVARSAGWWWPYANVAILTERPAELHRDNRGHLHAAGGPALRYPDGFALHAWHGAPIAAESVERLWHLTRQRIAEEPDLPLRQVLLEHYGYGRYVLEGGARRVAADEFGVLWSARFPDDEPLMVVEVPNLGPDGASRTSWLRVPPQTRTAREGVAWTFGLAADQYRPLAQS